MSENIINEEFNGKKLADLHMEWLRGAKEQEEYDRQPPNPCRTFDDLSPLVKRIVTQLIGLTPKPANRDHYDLAKVAISLCCGWDEPSGRGGHDQYKVAIDAYVDAMGL